MILKNNNFSVLPFYKSPAERDSNKWYVNGKRFPLYMMQNECLPFQIIDETGTIDTDSQFTVTIYNAQNGALNRTIAWAQIRSHFAVKTFDDYSVLVCDGGDWIVRPGGVLTGLPNGTFYMVVEEAMSDKKWYSDYFVYVNDTEPYLCLSWRDNSDFVMDSGVIVYTNPWFINKLYLPATLAKPEYPFEEEGESRDGVFYPTKQISSKRYRFTFFAPEYLLDVLRFVRMSEQITIAQGSGDTRAEYNVDNILFTPEWESQGDLAAVTCEFDTDTIAKKIGVAYVR